ncbi:MAG: aminoglycoside phosphotransferase family protein [Planctomycetota bacterium]|nr:aminoglycoside phosphotransferase family protein [Planctomycetota bacterium]
MEHIDIARAFGLEVKDNQFPESLYAYSPVYRLSKGGRDWVLKRAAKDPKRAKAVCSWLASLTAQACKVVSPETFPGENPRRFRMGEEAEMWVVYPFIEGIPYTGSQAQFRQAGALLGQIHSMEQEDLGLPQLQSIVAIDSEVYEEDKETILNCVRRALPELEKRAVAQLNQFGERYFSEVLDELIQESFPQVNCTWDFKASNLIYPPGESPWLIDPDNAGFIPRIYDLAIAALLFHNDGILEQSRALTLEQWTSFLQGYVEKVALTAQERRHWQNVLLAVWMDEALWLLANHEEGWQDPRQEKYLAELLLIDLDQFSLD